MVSRVVLGCGAVGHRFVLALADRDGIDAAVCTDEGRASSLREANVPTTHADPTDVDALTDLPDCEIVLVATDDPVTNTEIARVARTRYPEAYVMAYVGQSATDEERARLEATVDSLVDPEPVVLDTIRDQIVGTRAEDARRLREIIRAVEGTLAVVMHDNPDPDAIASAVALATLSNALGTPAEPCYYGEISHQENRALVNLLELELTNLDPDDDPRETYGGFALVDHSRPGVNDQLPVSLDVDVVIDHHPPRGAVPSAYTDLRADAGATSTLVIDHFHRYGITPSPTVATALLYGIQVDTDDFVREVSTLDFEAAASILPQVDTDVLERVDSPSVTSDTMETLANAIEHRQIRGSVLVSSVGRITDRDALPQAADKLLTMDGITTVLVFGLMDDDVFMSARARGAHLDLGETLRVAFDQIGSAGGHADMAGAQIPITDAFGSFEDDAAELDAIRDVVTESFFDALQDRPDEKAAEDTATPDLKFGLDNVGDASD